MYTHKKNNKKNKFVHVTHTDCLKNIADTKIKFTMWIYYGASKLLPFHQFESVLSHNGDAMECVTTEFQRAM